LFKNNSLARSIFTIFFGIFALCFGACSRDTSISRAGSSDSSNISTPSVTAEPATLASLAFSISSLSTVPRKATQVQVVGTYSDGSTKELTDTVSWAGSDSSVLSIEDSSGLLTARKTGTSTVSVSHSGIAASLPVSVSATNMIVQWAGWGYSGHGLYSPSGSLLSSLVVDSPADDLRGLLALPGGFLSVGTAALGDPVSRSFANSGSELTVGELEVGNWTQGPQAITKLSSGEILVPQYYSSVVNIYAADGSYISSFGTGAVSHPFQAVELNDGRIVVSSWDGKLVAFSRSGTNFTLIGDLATGFANPFGLDYCPSTDRLIMSDYSERKVYSCTTSGACSILADHALAEPRAIRRDVNVGDCSFYLGYLDSASGLDKIAHFNTDGSLANANWATMPAGGRTKVYQMDFLIP
jgi:hypothetical protein